ncbi:hypothetical protein [Pseudomonas sp. H3_G09]
MGLPFYWAAAQVDTSFAGIADIPPTSVHTLQSRRRPPVRNHGNLIHISDDAPGVLAIGIGFATLEQADDITGPIGPDLVAMTLQFFQADRPNLAFLTAGPACHEQAAQ